MNFKWSLVLVFACIIGFGTTIIAQNELKVMSWNIRLDTPVDGKNAWDFRKVALVNTISDVRPDLFGLQEVVHHQLTYITSQLTDYEYLGVGRTDGQQLGEYSPVFFLKSHFERIDNGNFWLSKQSEIPGSKGWDAAYERIVSWVQLIDKNSGDTVWFFNTHFDHLGKLAQLESAKLIKTKIGEFTQGQTCILTGDFNVTPDEEPYSVLIDSKDGFKDARNIVGILVEKQNQISFTGFDQLSENDALIDFIFFDKASVSSFYEVLKVNQGGFYVSDHLPVTAVIGYSKK